MTNTPSAYTKKKLRDIEAEVAIAVGVANMVGCMTGRCTDGVIKARDEATANIQKMVHQILKRELKIQKHD